MGAIGGSKGGGKGEVGLRKRGGRVSEAMAYSLP